MRLVKIISETAVWGYVGSISEIQQLKIIADLSRISSYYLGWAAGVKPKPEPAWLPVLAILAFNLTFLET